MRNPLKGERAKTRRCLRCGDTFQSARNRYCARCLWLVDRWGYKTEKGVVMGESPLDKYIDTLEKVVKVKSDPPPASRYVRFCAWMGRVLPTEGPWWFEAFVFLGCLCLSGLFLWGFSAFLKWVTG